MSEHGNDRKKRPAWSTTTGDPAFDPAGVVEVNGYCFVAAGEVERLSDYRLPCDVHLPEAIVIKAGCTLATLKLAMEQDYRPRHFSGNPRAALAQPDAVAGEVERLREALGRIAQFVPKKHPPGRWSEDVSGWNRLGNLVSGIARAALGGGVK